MKTQTALLLGLALLPAPALADADLEAVLARLGVDADRSAEEARIPEMTLNSGDVTLTLTDVLARQEGPDVVLSTDADIRLAFTSALSRSGIAQEADAPKEVTREFALSAPEGAVRISDLTEESVVGKFEAPSLGIRSDYEDAVTDLTAEMRGVSGDFALDTTPGAENRVAFRQSDARYTVKDETTETEGTLGAIEGTMAMTLPAQSLESYATPLDAIAEGLRASTTLKVERMTQEMRADGMGFKTEDGPLTFAAMADPDGIVINGTATGGALDSLEAGGPGYTYGASDLSVKIPTMAEGSDGFHIRMNAAEIAPNAAGWEMIDPNATLEREPLNVRLGVAGTISDLAGQAFGGLPSLRELTLEALEISGMGARVSGTGTFTMVPETGMPQDGNLTISLQGVTQLIDGMVAAGVLPATEANTLRMPLAMFAKPVSDTESVIEVNVKDGKTSLNGSPLN